MPLETTIRFYDKYNRSVSRELGWLYKLVDQISLDIDFQGL